MGGLGRPLSGMFPGWKRGCRVKMMPIGTQQIVNHTLEVPGRLNGNSTTVVITYSKLRPPGTLADLA